MKAVELIRRLQEQVNEFGNMEVKSLQYHAGGNAQVTDVETCTDCILIL